MRIFFRVLRTFKSLIKEAISSSAWAVFKVARDSAEKSYTTLYEYIYLLKNCRYCYY